MKGFTYNLTTEIGDVLEHNIVKRFDANDRASLLAKLRLEEIFIEMVAPYGTKRCGKALTDGYVIGLS